MLEMLIAQGTGSSESGFNLGDAYTMADGKPVSEYFSKPSDLINLITPNLFVIAGIAVLVMAILAGYNFIAKGQKGMEDAMKIVGAGLAGLIIMFAAYWVIQIINQLTGAGIPL